MKIRENKVLILKDDYDLLNACVKNTRSVTLKETHQSRSLSEELTRAIVVERDHFPMDVIRLNSMVTITDLATGKDITLTIVLPEYADFKQQKVSVLAPMGTALIGFKKGQNITWQVPAGLKNFLIVDVKQS